MKASIRRLGLLLTLALALPGHLFGDSVSVTITVDNGYGFGFGDTNGILAGQYYGGVDNCTDGHRPRDIHCHRQFEQLYLYRGLER